MTSRLRILAGADALPILRDRGLVLEDFDMLVAAAGGTKFLLLGGLDRVLFPALRRARRVRLLHCVSSSIGSLRTACLFSRDPSAALERLARRYISHRRDEPIDAASIVAKLVDTVLEGEPLAQIAEPSWASQHVLAARCTGLVASDRPALLLSGLGLAAAGNLLSRRTLGLQFTRTLFHSRGEPGPLAALADLPTSHRALTAENLAGALVASASVPVFAAGAAVPGDPGGVYRDAALVDYHPVPPDHEAGGLVLYPHFYGHLTPGWFDRALPFRRARGARLGRTVLLAPSEAFVASLPGGARPTRRDVRRYGDREREARWQEVWTRGNELGAALEELLSSPARVAAALAPLE